MGSFKIRTTFICINTFEKEKKWLISNIIEKQLDCVA